MRRRHLFEIHDLPGCPEVLRRIATDYLGTVGRVFRAFAPVAPLLERLARETNASALVDLCSGTGGPPMFLAEELARTGGPALEVVLTDLYPNRAAFERATGGAPVRVRAETSPVDARHVPDHLRGIRTLFDSFHHFREEDARQILADAARSRAPLLIVEGTERSVRGIISLLLVAPLLTLLLTPLVRPFTWWRLVLTYLVPVAPLVIVFDGVVSCLRTYTAAELREMTRDLQDGYSWEIGTVKSHGQPLSYVIGRPA